MSWCAKSQSPKNPQLTSWYIYLKLFLCPAVHAALPGHADHRLVRLDEVWKDDSFWDWWYQHFAVYCIALPVQGLGGHGGGSFPGVRETAGLPWPIEAGIGIKWHVPNSVWNKTVSSQGPGRQNGCKESLQWISWASVRPAPKQEEGADPLW